MTRFSVVVPVYKNEGSIPQLVDRLERMDAELDGGLEAVFVVDGSPDRSYLALKERLAQSRVRSQLLALSRNFGSFAAIRQGMAVARGPYFAVMAADLQEPPDVVIEFFRRLSSDEVDVTVGVRTGRSDPFLSAMPARIFWWAYRRFVQREVPVGGVDVFGCNSAVRDALLSMHESHSSLVGLLFWLGFRREEVQYHRQPREHGTSGWGFRRKVRYLLDSVFAFTDLPISMLAGMGSVGIALSLALGVVVVTMRLLGRIPVLGYAPIMLLLLLSTSGILLALGIVGSYVWRTYENSKGRPLFVPLSHETFGEDPQ
jgi:glycosyltransferase involved in cell wall biosynthesis